MRNSIEGEDVKRMKKFECEVAIVCAGDNTDIPACMLTVEGETEKYDKICLELRQELHSMGVEAAMVSQEADWSSYKVLFVPRMHLKHGETGEKIRDFVAEGGTILATYFMGCENKDLLREVEGVSEEDLWSVFGITREEIDVFSPSEWNGIIWSNGARIRTMVRDYAEILQIQSAEVLATFETDFYAGKAAITKNQFGNGYVYYVAGGIAAADLRGLFERMLTEAGIETGYPEETV